MIRAIAILACVLALMAFHSMMRADAARLCANDATAYPECS